MKVKIENLGEESVRVITDDDPENDAVLEAGAVDIYESEDIELRDDVGRDDEDDESGTDAEPSST